MRGQANPLTMLGITIEFVLIALVLTPIFFGLLAPELINALKSEENEEIANTFENTIIPSLLRVLDIIFVIYPIILAFLGAWLLMRLNLSFSGLVYYLVIILFSALGLGVITFFSQIWYAIPFFHDFVAQHLPLTYKVYQYPWIYFMISIIFDVLLGYGLSSISLTPREETMLKLKELEEETEEFEY